MARLVDAQPGLVGQAGPKGLVRLAQGGRSLLHHLDQLPGTQRQAPQVLEEGLNGRVRHAAGRLLVDDQGREARPDQAAASNVRGQRGKHDLTGGRVAIFSRPVLGDFKRLFGQFDLLDHLPVVQRLQARGLGFRQFIGFRPVDLLRGKGRSLVLGVARLAAELAPAGLRRRGFRGLDQVRGRRLGGVRGIGFQPGDLGLQAFHQVRQGLNPIRQLGNNDVFLVHPSL